MASYRPLEFGVTGVTQHEQGGCVYVQATQPLQDYAERIIDRFVAQAKAQPQRLFMARRVLLEDGSRGAWQELSYGAAYAQARACGQALLDAGASLERPLAILSENSLEHAVLALAAMMAGVPYCPVSTAYSLVSQDFAKLRHVLATLTPAVVYAADAKRFGPALSVVQPDTLVLTDTADAHLHRRRASFADWLKTPVRSQLDEALASTHADTVVKFLFTSGSTKLPKAVINTNRMWCSNQQQMRQSMPVLQGAPPLLVDWLPWNHTFGGNHNFGMVVYNGGTLYIDDGKPAPALIGQTLRNLREIAPTLYFNVPTGFEAIARAMKTDAALRRNLLSKVQMFFYAGAALAQPVWDSLFESAEHELGERIVMTTGLGMTESGPFGLFVTSPDVKAGDLGVPTPGLQIKLVPTDGKTEVRYRGPNITPGYWRNEAATQEAFDEEGFLRTGDAVRWIDAANAHRGLCFDGRIAEDFKLATGTFVSVGPLRAKIIAACAPYVQDAVITGLDRAEVGALLIPIAPAMRALSALPEDAVMSDVLQHEKVTAHFQNVLNALAASATGSASRVARMSLLAEPPSLDKGEITDKGSINQRAVLEHRAALVHALYDDEVLSPTTIVLRPR